MRTNTVLAVAEFDSRLPRYFLIQSCLAMLFSVFLIPLIPFWILFIGAKVHRRQYDALSAVLTDRALNVSKGFLFKTQKNIPLDKITDLAVNEGPILRYLGLCSLQIETAGGGQQGAMGNASLLGVVDALEFRDQVLEQRDRVTGIMMGATAPLSPPDDSSLDSSVAPVSAVPSPDSVPAARNLEEHTVLLTEIRDTLREIASELSSR